MHACARCYDITCGCRLKKMKIKVIPVLSLLFAAFIFAAVFTGCTTSTDDTGSGNDSTVAVTGVSISGSSSVATGSTITLSATVNPGNATNKTVSWSSGNTSRATVNSSTGTVTGVAAGTAVITATAGGKSATKTITVNAASSDGTVTLSGTNGSIIISDMSGTSFTVSYTPSAAITSCAAYGSVGDGTGLAFASAAMKESSETWTYTATDSSYASGVKIFILLYTSSETAVPQGTLSDATCSDWASFTYGTTDSGDDSGSDSGDGSENDTVTDGATDGTSVTGSDLSYVASDTTWDTIVWSDEFEGTALKTANWTYDTGAGGWGNSELETYTTSNAAVHGGVLDITADSSLNSSRIKSSGLKTFQYGKIVARIKCSQGTGSWPAFWMLGTSSSSWPYQGEIDIMEHANSDTFTYQTCHWNSNGKSTSTTYSHASWGQTTNDNYWNDISSMDVTEWHTYAIEWTSSLIEFYVDDTKVMAMDIGSSSSGTDTFNYPFYIIFNFAMGGQFPNVYSSSSFTGVPWHMYVDYVRVYQ
ncbi:MAG TPA: hypothetical protein DCL73_04405 [Treponema sp.]|nr:hypothetical protein [Treponema sp.]